MFPSVFNSEEKEAREEEENFIQGYYNTGWFNPKMSSCTTLWFCQQTISEQALLYRAWMGVKVLSEFVVYTVVLVNHKTFISHWKCQMGTAEYLLRGMRSIISRLIAKISSGVLTQADSVIFNWSFLDCKYKDSKPRGHS